MPTFKTLPNKWLRKAVFDALDGISVNGKAIPVFDFRVPVTNAPEAYILMDSQTAQPAKTKCEYDWTCTLRLEVINQTPKSGNPGSRVLLNDIANTAIAAFNVLFALDPASGLQVLWQNIEAGTDFVRRCEFKQGQGIQKNAKFQ